MKTFVINLNAVSTVIWHIAEACLFIGGMLALAKGDYAIATPGILAALYMRDKKFV
jgi:hypothetical protein